jgi:hypothetical protein
MNQMSALVAIVAVGVATFGTASMSGAQQAGSNEDDAAIRKVIAEMTVNRLPNLTPYRRPILALTHF